LCNQFAQLSNLYTHIYLSSLRKPNSTERKIPYGYGFDLVSCPNYLFEILGWVAFSVLTGSYACTCLFSPVFCTRGSN